MPKYELAEGWPHKHLNEYPDELHISPRTAYFVEDGKVMAMNLESLTKEEVLEAYDILRKEGVEVPESQ